MTPTTFVVFAALLSFMVLVHELGHFVMAKVAGIRVEEFGIGFPPRLLSVRRGETIYSVNAVPLGGFVRMLGEEDPTQPRSFARARKRWRIGILVAGSVMNLIAAGLFFSVAQAAGWPTVVASQVEVQEVVAGSPAEQAGLRNGDVVVSLAGQPVQMASDLQRITQENLGRPTALDVRRADQSVQLTVTPRANPPDGQGAMGVRISDRPTRVEPVKYPFPAALVRGVRELARSVLLTVSIPYLVFERIIPLEAARPVGPVGLFQATSQATLETVRTGWWFPVLFMAGTLGSGLAIANLLPIPGLDGGRLLFVLLEIVRGRRVSPEREGFIHLVGMAVLLSLVLVITYYDILSPLSIDFTMR